jgi:hypothetical protein
MYPNNVLSAWQMTLMITVPLTLLVGWVIAVFLAARQPAVPGVAATASPAQTTVPAPRLPDVTVPQSPAQPDVPAPLAA